MFGVLAYGDSVLRLAPRGFNVLPTQAPATTGAGPTSVLYAYCQDVDDMYARATLAGAKSDDAPSDMPWGDRICILADPDGYIWSFATKYVEE